MKISYSQFSWNTVPFLNFSPRFNKVLSTVVFFRWSKSPLQVHLCSHVGPLYACNGASMKNVFFIAQLYFSLESTGVIGNIQLPLTYTCVHVHMNAITIARVQQLVYSASPDPTLMSVSHFRFAPLPWDALSCSALSWQRTAATSWNGTASLFHCLKCYGVAPSGRPFLTNFTW